MTLGILNLDDVFVDWLGARYTLCALDTTLSKLSFLTDHGMAEAMVIAMHVTEDHAKPGVEVKMEIQWIPGIATPQSRMILTRRMTGKPRPTPKTLWERLLKES